MRVRVKVFAAAAAAVWALVPGAVHAGALDECMVKGDHAAVTRCLAEQDAQAQAQLRAAEGAAATWARELDRATGTARCRRGAGRVDADIRRLSQGALRLRAGDLCQRHRRRAGHARLPHRHDAPSRP